jgi:dTDP-4-amino-4,6-dideoxygalactose transaminase
MVYYPVALHLQQAFRTEEYGEGDYPVSEALCEAVLSFPMHTEMSRDQIDYIILSLNSFKNS